VRSVNIIFDSNQFSKSSPLSDSFVAVLEFTAFHSFSDTSTNLSNHSSFVWWYTEYMHKSNTPSK